MTDQTYECGCRSRDGIVIARCAWAAETKARISSLEDDKRLVPAPGLQLTPTGIRVIDCIGYVWADQEDVLRLCRELSAHYPSKLAAPQPCGPVEVTP